MAEQRLGATGKDGCQAVSPSRDESMTNRVDAALEPMQVPGGHSVLYRTVRVAEGRFKLTNRDYAVLAFRQLRQSRS